MTALSVLGAGSWGTALALALARHGAAVRLWTRNPAHAAELEALRGNARYLPGVVLPPAIDIHTDLGAAVAGTQVLVAVPSGAFPGVLEALAGLAAPPRELAWATKGLAPGDARLLHELVLERLGPDCRCAVVSGPSFARELAIDLPTAVAVAANDAAFARAWARYLHGGRLRAYPSADLVGVQLGGAVKNVLAIAAGISDGLELGANARAALITRGLAEMSRLGAALGGEQATFLGLAGVGDLLLTCGDDQSRNRRVGLGLGRGRALADILGELGQVAEGVPTAYAVTQLCARAQVEMPICEAVTGVLDGARTPREAVAELLGRAMTAER